MVFVAVVVTGIFANRVAIQKSNDAVEKSCLLLDKKIQEATSNAANPSGSTTILIAAIIRRMTPKERLQLAEARRKFPNGGNVSRLNCKKIISEPEAIHSTEGEAS